MYCLIQRVSRASVDVNQKTIAKIQQGLLALIGFHADDNADSCHACIEKVSQFRLFADEHDKMNRSLIDIGGGLLLVPQFTLVADTSRGRRPSFTSAAPPEVGKQLFTQLCDEARNKVSHVAQGEFGANMQVSLINDGPATFAFHF